MLKVHIILIAALCIAGCKRVHPEQPSEQLLTDAWADFRLSEFSGSSIKFEQVLRQSQDPILTRTRLEAEYGLATIAAMGEEADPAKARPLFEQIIHEAPNSDIAGWSRLMIIRMQQQIQGTDSSQSRKQLEDGYRAIISDFPDSPPADEAFVHLQALRLIPLSPEDARQVVKDITAYLSQGKTHFASALYGLRSMAYRLCKEYRLSFDDAVVSMQRQEKDPVNPLSVDAGTLYALGMAAQFDVGDFAVARQFYDQFLQQYPTDQRAFTVRLLMKNMDKVESDLIKSPDRTAVGEGP